MTTPVIHVEHVTRRFGPVTALDDVSLAVQPGELVGMLGPNGAGKTTLLSLVNGLRKPDAGTVRLFGGDPRDPASRTRLGSTPQETGLPPTLKVTEVVDFVAHHYPNPRPTAQLRSGACPASSTSAPSALAAPSGTGWSCSRRTRTLSSGS